MNLEWTLLALRLLALAVLYAFLVLIVYVVWRDLRTTAPSQRAGDPAATYADGAEAPAGYLRLVAGEETLLQPGAFIPLEAHVTLGRAPDNHIVLSDTYVSSYHARLDRRDGEWWLTDLGSRNGTRLNDVPITKSVPLADGDIIGLGQMELKLEIVHSD